MNLLQSWAEHYRAMRRLGATRASLLAFPIRRRLNRELSLQYKNGASLTMPEGEPMFEILDEVWEKERYWRDEFQNDLQNGDIVDIGAHMGTFTLWAAKRWPERRVIAVEPSPINLEYLEKNV